MDFLRKVTDNHIVKVELLSLLSDAVITITPEEGHFAKTDLATLKLDKIYFTVNSASLTESGKPTEAGYQYQQEFSFKMPNNEDRVSIIKRYRYLRALRIHFVNGTHVDIARNDYHQNAPIPGEYEADKNFVHFSWKIATIFPLQIL